MYHRVYLPCIFQNSFTALKIPCALPIHFSPPIPYLLATDLYTVSIVLPFAEYCIVRIMQCVSFLEWAFEYSDLIMLCHQLKPFHEHLLFLVLAHLPGRLLVVSPSATSAFTQVFDPFSSHVLLPLLESYFLPILPRKFLLIFEISAQVSLP